MGCWASRAFASGAPGRSGDGLEITSTTLGRALDEVSEGLTTKRDADDEDRMRPAPVSALISPAEESPPVEG